MEDKLNQSNTVADSNHQHLRLSRERAPPLDIPDAIVTSLAFGVMMQLWYHQWIELWCHKWMELWTDFIVVFVVIVDKKNLKSNRHWINHSLSDKVAFRAVTGHLGWPTLLLEWEGMSWFCSCSWNKTLTVKSCIFTKFQFNITAWKSYIWGPCDRIVKG